MRRATLGVLALSYGLFRALGFHPVLRGDYREWLLATPWRPEQPLPLGPVHLVIQDLVLVGASALLLLAVRAEHPADPAIAFLVAYVVGSLVPLRLSRALESGLLVAGAGLVTLPSTRVGVLVALGALACAGSLSMRRTLDLLRPAAEEQEVTAGRTLGLRAGPGFARLAPVDAGQSRPSALQAFAWSGMIAWWQFLIAHALSESAAETWEIARTISLGGTFVVVGGRLLTDLAGHGPPLGLRLRLKLRRFLLPGFDVVLVTPALMASIGLWFAPISAPVIGDQLSCAIATFAVWLLGFRGGPAGEWWRLVGLHSVETEPSTSPLTVEIVPSQSLSGEPRRGTLFVPTR